MTQQALVAGGGIGGLATAIWLEQKGIAPTVLERAPQLGKIGPVSSLGRVPFMRSIIWAWGKPRVPLPFTSTACA